MPAYFNAINQSYEHDSLDQAQRSACEQLEISWQSSHMQRSPVSNRFGYHLGPNVSIQCLPEIKIDLRGPLGTKSKLNHILSQRARALEVEGERCKRRVSSERWAACNRGFNILSNSRETAPAEALLVDRMYWKSKLDKRTVVSRA